jgi:hypothetical protein
MIGGESDRRNGIGVGGFEANNESESKFVK